MLAAMGYDIEHSKVTYKFSRPNGWQAKFSAAAATTDGKSCIYARWRVGYVTSVCVTHSSSIADQAGGKSPFIIHLRRRRGTSTHFHRRQHVV